MPIKLFKLTNIPFIRILPIQFIFQKNTKIAYFRESIDIVQISP